MKSTEQIYKLEILVQQPFVTISESKSKKAEFTPPAATGIQMLTRVQTIAPLSTSHFLPLFGQLLQTASKQWPLESQFSSWERRIT